MRPLPALILSLQFGRFADAAQHRTVLPRHRVRRWLRHALLADVQVAEITVRIVGAEEGQQLNRDYRHKDYATNVLTFVYGEGEAMPGANEEGMPLTGDLVLCVPVLVREVPNEAAAAMALIENIQREDLNPLEEAQGLQRLIREFGLTHEQAAQAVGRSRSAASNLLRLLNLAEPVQTMLMAGDIDMGHARALLALDRAAQITAGNQIAAKKLSVREAESLVKKIGAEFNLVPQKPKKEKSRDMKRVEEELSDLLMAAVEVRVKKRVKRAGRMEDMGELAIQFGSLEELNGLIERLRG
jgi:ParB-like chromosome segregation protein Spo0J